MILHCKNAEMTIIILSFLHFYSVKSYNFFFFFFVLFLNLAVFYIGENKKVKNKIFIFFLKCKNLGWTYM